MSRVRAGKRRGLLIGAVSVLAGAAAVHLAAILLYPYVMTGFLRDRMVEKAGINAFHHARRPTAEERTVPMPSPDLVYSAAAYDVSKGPIRITAPTTGSYMSLSLYAENMDNFFVENDRQVQGGRFDVVLCRPGGEAPRVEGAQVVHAPSDTGIMLFRCFAGDGSEAQRIEAARRQIRCERLR